MDFVFKLPPTVQRHDGIWVVVDRLTKSAHFLPIREKFSPQKLAELFMNHIVSLYGVPVSIISDRDPRFTSRFWKRLMKELGVKLNLSTAFHPPTDGQCFVLISVPNSIPKRRNYGCLALQYCGNPQVVSSGSGLILLINRSYSPLKI